MKRLFCILSMATLCVAPTKSFAAGEATNTPEPNAAETFDLGRKLLRGEGVEKDTKRSFVLISEAAAAGHPEAMGAMGYFYASAVEVQQDATKAAEWFRRGAEAGSAKAQYNLGNSLLKGRGVKRDEAEGVRWIKMAAEAGMPEAQCLMGFAYLNGNEFPGVSMDSTKAHEMFAAAAEAGLPDAQNALGLILGDGGDHDASILWYRRSADQGFPKAQANLGRALLNSAASGESEKRIEGLQWLLLAQQVKEPTAQNSLNELMPGCSGSEIEQARQRVGGFKPASERE